ncbi:DNA starvation/stationary phase protection protein [Nocardioides dongxiaopingii]|uniref:Dps family protein n=1 Tax=Nocardioides TaxID=1839 RepID=UPI0010C76828|nr:MULTISPECIES: DNA starvation/stationary phase protection protein [Nocardioides]QCW51956.1 DNA starvation/stationary phase protection protein [Nocardioides sp. S-1144]
MATSTGKLRYTTPGIPTEDAERVVELLQGRLHATNDLHLTLKHVHWNVVGPHFIAVHEMIDPQVDEVRAFSDSLAERIATLGGSPQGTPGVLVAERTWEEYSIGRATTQEHLGALDLVYQGVITSYRDAIKELEELDVVSQDMLIGQTDKLELFHWFVRAHLEDKSGALSTAGAGSEQEAASAAAE